MVYDYKDWLLKVTTNEGNPYHLFSIFRFASLYTQCP